MATKNGISSINKVLDTKGNVSVTPFVIKGDNVLCDLENGAYYPLDQKLAYLSEYAKQGVYIDTSDSQASYLS